jgi:hypothetical protein
LVKTGGFGVYFATTHFRNADEGSFPSQDMFSSEDGTVLIAAFNRLCDEREVAVRWVIPGRQPQLL